MMMVRRLGRLLQLVAVIIGTAHAQTAPLSATDSEFWDYGHAEVTRRAESATFTKNEKKAKNVILFVADGNGISSNYITRLFAGQQNQNRSKGRGPNPSDLQGGVPLSMYHHYGDEHVLPAESMPYLALSKTYNTNAQTPDSVRRMHLHFHIFAVGMLSRLPDKHTPLSLESARKPRSVPAAKA